VHLFRGFPSLDPELPAELTAPWSPPPSRAPSLTSDAAITSDLAPAELAPLLRSRARAVDVFHDLYEKLAESSQRYFEAATADPAMRVGRVSRGRR
jgi:DNA-binding transcriptional regulator PaaX